MPKRIDNIFDQSLKFKYMYEAFDRTSECKRYNKEVILYKMNLANNITNTLKALLNNTYKIGEYNKFKITKPKERIIQSLPFKDRIVQQWYVEQFIKPIFIPKFITDSYACIPGRGVHSAVRRLKKFLYNAYLKNKDSYILKCDIAKFFYTINKDILYNIITKYIKDKKVLNLTKIFIYDNDESLGIPIGNYTSQYFANIYMNVFDHYIKEQCKVKYYVRYVDDFILVLDSKEQCILIKQKIEKFLNENLGLKLNSKTTYFKINCGVNFLGYKVFYNHILLRTSNKKKIYKKIKKLNKLYENKTFDFEKARQSLNSWIGHAKNANSYHLINDVMKRCKWISKEYK